MSNTFIEINGKSVLINENTVCTIRKILKEDVVFLIADVEEYSYYPVTLLKDIAEIINELLLYLQGHKMYDN